MEELLLTIDVGNTNTVVGLFDDTKLLSCWRLTTVGERTADEIGLWILQLLEWWKVTPQQLGGVAVASVVPELDARLTEAVPRYLHQDAFFVEPGVEIGMPLRVESPHELGADRICDAVAGLARFGGPCVVIDFGTAVTWEVVSAAGEYLGGVIAPGPGVTSQALFARAAKLPHVALSPPTRVIGKATVDSIQSGIFFGYLGLVEGITRRVLAEVPGAVVVATGGRAKLFAEHSELIHKIEPDLTLEGLRILWLKNRGGTTV